MKFWKRRLRNAAVAAAVITLALSMSIGARAAGTQTTGVNVSWESSIGSAVAETGTTKLNTNTITLTADFAKGEIPDTGQNVTVQAVAASTNPNAIFTKAVWYIDGTVYASTTISARESAATTLVFPYQGQKSLQVAFFGHVLEDTAAGWDIGEFRTDSLKLEFTPPAAEAFRWLQEPSSVTANDGGTATFYAVSNDQDATYQWYKTVAPGADGTAIEGATGENLSVLVKKSINAQYVYCVATTTDGIEHRSSSGQINVFSAPQLSAAASMERTVYALQEDDHAISAGVESAGAPGTLTYQWQVSTDRGETWADCVDGTSNLETYIVPAAHSTDRNEYRCVVSNTQFETTTAPVTVRTAGTPSVVLISPTVKVWEDADITYTAEADPGVGPESLTVQWYIGESEETSEAIEGATALVYTRTIVMADDGLQLWCQVWNGLMGARSDAVTLEVEARPPAFEVQGNPEGWTNQNVVLSIVLKNPERKLPANPYSWDGGATWTSSSTKTVTENTTLDVRVRDATGADTAQVVTVDKIDKTSPEPFTITGAPDSWTNQPVTLSASTTDGESGVALDAYNWGNLGFTSNSSITVVENGTVNLKIRDRAGNTAEASVVVDKIDMAAPEVTYISPMPEEWTTTPIRVTVQAADYQSGIGALAYSFDDGEHWQTIPTYEFDRTGVVGLKIRDRAGNVAYHPFRVENVDAVGPEFSIASESISPDMAFVTVHIYAIDNEPNTAILYCYDYDPAAGAEGNTWVEASEWNLRAGATVTVACKDWIGNITYQEYTPTVYTLRSDNSALELLATGEVPAAGWTFGALDNSGNGKYLDSAGNVFNYQSYRVNGRTVKGIAIQIQAAPIGGGYLYGEASVNGTTFPIYWDEEFRSRTTQEESTGYIIINPASFTSSSRNAVFKIEVGEYEDEALTKELNRDSISAAVMIDVTAPTINLSYQTADKTVTATVKDLGCEIVAVKYQVETSNGKTEWLDYTAPVKLTETSVVTVAATDKVGNTQMTSTEKINVVSSLKESGTEDVYDSSYRYRTALFDHYLFGTGKKNA